MARILKAAGVVAAVAAVAAAGLVGYVAFALPNVGPPPDLRVDRSPEAVERGRYLANAVARSVNITPDAATGIGDWSLEFFVKRFKAYADPAYVSPKAQEVGLQTPMPWLVYAQMTDVDLRAIYAYSRTVPARRNTVEKFTPAR